MLLKATAKFSRKTYEFFLDTDKLDRNYDDEPYAYWIIKQNGKWFEINILKTHEVDGNLTNEGYVKKYKNKEDMEEDFDFEMISNVKFTAYKKIAFPKNLK